MNRSAIDIIFRAIATFINTSEEVFETELQAFEMQFSEFDTLEDLADGLEYELSAIGK